MLSRVVCWSALCLFAAQAARAGDSLDPATLAALKDATVFLRVAKGDVTASGSGFLVRTDGETGYVVTNHHVVALRHVTRHVTYPQVPRSVRNRPGYTPQPPAVRYEEHPIDNPAFTAILFSGTRNERSVPGEVVASDPKADLAVVKVGPVSGLPRPIDLSREAELTETLPVFAFGFPLGQRLATGRGGPAVTVTKGAISSVRRNDRDEVAVVQIDSDLNPGNSGGPVVDAQGRLVGVAVAKVRDTRIGLAVPSRELTALVEGRAGDARLEMAGARAVRVEVEMIDPLDRVRSVTLHYAPASAAKGRPGPDGLAGPREGGKVVLERKGRRAVGAFPVELPDGGELALSYQVAWAGPDGKTHRGNRHAFVARAPDRAPAVAAESAPASRSADALPTTRGIAAARSAVVPEARPAGKPLADAELTRALADLPDPARSGAAAELLARARPEDGRRAEVVKVLRAVAADKRVNAVVRGKSVRALGVWGTERDVDLLAPLASDDNAALRAEAIDALGWLGGEKSAEAVIGRLDDAGDHERALKSLARMGPAAEETVVAELLGSPKASLRLAGCRLLQTIGTEASLSPVEKLAQNDGSDAVRLTAGAAANAIKARQGTAGK